MLGEIDSTEDKLDMLKPLAIKLKAGDLNCNIDHCTINILINAGVRKVTIIQLMLTSCNIQITTGMNKVTNERKVHFTHHSIDSDFIEV